MVIWCTQLITTPSVSLYIHTPWCVKKCPYCDFNSHTGEPNENLQNQYIDTLLSDFQQQRSLLQNRPLGSVFIGGGTPSLFAPNTIKRLLNSIQQYADYDKNWEVTLEANPGTLDNPHLDGYLAAGVNRLSLGIQSFHDFHLQALGRIHTAQHAHQAIHTAQTAGFQSINLDLMYALPGQSVTQGLADLHQAICANVSHISWYQLTLEPHTPFFHTPPPSLPDDDTSDQLAQDGYALLQNHHFKAYEVSAYAQAGKQCRHNLNYWQFGDYLGIGAGAHSKISLSLEQRVIRFSRPKSPAAYQQQVTQTTQPTYSFCSTKDLIGEFMMNALRLTKGFDLTLFTRHTGLPQSLLQPLLNEAISYQWITLTHHHLTVTPLGQRYLNDLILLFIE